MIPSATARPGVLSMSTISSSCLAAKCVSQIAWRLATAISELGALPATYSRRTSADFADPTLAILSDHLMSFHPCPAGHLLGTHFLVRVTQLAQGRLVSSQKGGCGTYRISQQRDLGAASFHFLPHDLQSRSGFGLSNLQIQPLELRGYLRARSRRLLLLFPLPASHSHEDFALGNKDVGQGDALIGEGQLPDLIGMACTARLDDGQCSIPLAILHDVGNVNPSVGDSGNVGGCLLVGGGPFHQSAD